MISKGILKTLLQIVTVIVCTLWW